MKKNGQKIRMERIVLLSLLICIGASFGNMAVAQDKEDAVYEEVAVMPKFQDGDVDTFRKWVTSNVKYPEAAKKDGVTGKVFAEFIVEKDGSVSKVKIKKGVPDYFDSEVIRVIKASPKWTPGKNKDGKIVRVSFVITVNFALN